MKLSTAFFIVFLVGMLFEELFRLLLSSFLEVVCG